MRIQSSDVEDIPSNEDGNVEIAQNVAFVDASAGEVGIVPSERPLVAIADGTADISLGKFLGRPTRIDTTVWTTATAVGSLVTLQPWYLFLNDAAIKRKIENFAFIRATLCVKTIINATPFHYGLARYCYEPSVGFRASKIRTNPTSSLPLGIPYSQLPGYHVQPADNSGGELRVPMFLHKNWARLNLASEIQSLGTLTAWIYAPLQVASSGGSTSVTLTTYAWLEDVELSGSTNSLTLQAGDEYTGVISAPATAVANIASRLKDAPVIGKFARATQLGASAIASIASLFGYTNTPNIDKVATFVPNNIPHLATSEISVPVQKLSLDPKQELSIDPTMHGIPNGDELSISEIAGKPSFLVAVPWGTADPVGMVLWNARISPSLYGQVPMLGGAGSTLQNTRVYHTPMSFLAMLFSHWKGDIELEFNVICSKFHKGRLRFSWDPYGGNATTVPNENTIYTTILDIGENNFARMRIPYHQDLAWLRTRTDVTTDNWTVGSALNYTNGFDNGLLSMSVQTPLISPVSSAGIYVIVRVRAPDVEFANPRNAYGVSTQTPSPTMLAVQSKDVVDISPDLAPIGDQGVLHSDRYGQNFGEAIASLRTLMHRHSLSEIVPVRDSAATRFSMSRIFFSRLPPWYGYDSTGDSSATTKLPAVGTTVSFNSRPTHLSTLVASLYGGYRGSTNYTIVTTSDLLPSVGTITVSRVNETATSLTRYWREVSTVAAGTNDSITITTLNNSGGFANFNFASGGAVTSTSLNGALSFNFPDYNNYNFAYVNPTTQFAGSSVDGLDRQWVAADMTFKQTSANATSRTLLTTVYTGTGPDFHCLWFLCVPTLDYYQGYPAAV